MLSKPKYVKYICLGLVRFIYFGLVRFIYFGLVRFTALHVKLWGTEFVQKRVKEGTNILYIYSISALSKFYAQFLGTVPIQLNCC